MIIYVVGYEGVDDYNTWFFAAEFVTEDFNKVIKFVEEHNNVDLKIQKWLDGKVIGEMKVVDGKFEDLELKPVYLAKEQDKSAE